MVGSYIKKTVGSVARKAAYVGTVLTLAALSYLPGTANAQEAPAPKKSTPIEALVDSYEQAYADSKGKGIDEQIFQIVTAAYQDPSISDEDRNNIKDDLVQRVSNVDIKKKIVDIAAGYAQMKQREFQARTAYQAEVMKASKQRDKDKIATLARAEKALCEKLAEAEFFVEGIQYAQELLDAAKRGLELAKQHPGLMLTEEFTKYIDAAEKAVEIAKNENHPLTELNRFNTAVEVALEHAEAAQKPEQRIQYYREAIDLLKEAERILPFDQYSARISEFQTRIKTVQEEAKKKKPEPAAEAKPEPKPEAKPEPEPKDEPKPADKPEANPADKKDDAPAAADSSKTKGFRDLIEGKRYDSVVEAGGGALTEDREGDFEHGSIRLSDMLDFKFLRQYENWVNAAGNNQNLSEVSAFLEFKPLAIPSLAFKMDPDIINFLKIGGFVQERSGTEWEYHEDVTEDSNFRVTMTENVRNTQKDIDLSTWAEAQFSDFLLRTSGFYKAKETETSIQSVTLNENLNDPSGTYSDSDLSSVTDVEILRGIKALAALRLNNGIKGHIGILGQFVEAYERLAGSDSHSKKTVTFGLDGKIRTEDDTFGAALALTQDLEENGKDKLTTARGFVAAALNISPIEFAEGKTLDALLFADAHAIAPRNGRTMYGCGGGTLVGNTAQILPQVLDWIADKDAYRIGLKPEVSEAMQRFTERRGFRNLLLTNMTEEWGAALAAYVETAKELGLDGKVDTMIAASAAGILDTPAAAFVLSGYYSDGILERTWGIDFIAHIKKHGFAVGAGFNQTNYLVTRQEVNGVEGYFMIPLGAQPKSDKK